MCGCCQCLGDGPNAGACECGAQGACPSCVKSTAAETLDVVKEAIATDAKTGAVVPGTQQLVSSLGECELEEVVVEKLKPLTLPLLTYQGVQDAHRRKYHEWYGDGETVSQRRLREVMLNDWIDLGGFE